MLSANAEYAKRKAEETALTAEVINPKLKQFYDVKIKIEPFYTGGKIVILSPTHFMCRCGPAVKVVSTTASVPEPRVGVVNVDLSMEVDTKDELRSFAVSGHYECEMDEILGFDACPSSKTLITAHKSDLLRIWNLETKQIERTIKSFHNLPIGLLEINKNKSAEVYRKAKESKLSAIEDIKDDVDNENLAFAPLTFATQESKNALSWITISGAIAKIWNAGGNSVSKLIRIPNVASVGFAKWDVDPTKKRAFVAERNIYVIDWNDTSQQFQIAQTCEGHYSQVTGLEWDSSSQLMISGGRDKVLILWDAEKQFTKLKTIPVPHSIEALALVSTKDLYLALSSSEIRHFDVKTHRLTSLSQLPLNKCETIESLHSPAPSGENVQEDSFYISTHTCTIYEVSRKSRDTQALQDNILQIKNQYVGSLEEILSVAFWTEGTVAVANNTSVIKVYNLSSGSCEFLRGHTDIVLTLRARRKWLVSGSKDNKIIVWLPDSLEPHTILEGHLASVTSVCFDPTNFIIYSVSEDTFLKAWDFKCLRSARAHDKEIHAVHCSPNGSIVATCSRDKTAKLWDAESFSLLGIMKGHKKTVWDVKFSKWDQLVATASADTNIKVWNTTTFQCIQTLQGHLSSVLHLNFFNLGLQIVSTSNDGTLKIWDLKSSLCMSTYESSDDKLWALDSEADGSLIVTGAADSVLTVWADKTEEKVEQFMLKKKKNTEDEQRLSNVLRRGDWTEAIKLSLELDRPYTLLKVIREIDAKEMAPVITDLATDHKILLTRYIKKWNTNTKTSTEAQLLLNILLTSTLPSDLQYLDVKTLIPYTEKHFNRIEQTMQHVVLVKYIADTNMTI